MDYRRDVLKQYLHEAITAAGNRKIILLGCRAAGAVTFCALRVLGIDVAYFLDIYTNGKTKFFFGKPVYPVSHVREEEPNVYYILNVFPYFDQIDYQLKAMGMVENRDYTNLHSYFKSKFCDEFDPRLGFNRQDDLPGFKQFGTENGKKLKIVALGGSTTDYSYSRLRSWPEQLHDMLLDAQIDNVIFNGGICGYTSAQEREKFLRDVLPLEPDIVLCLSGVNDIAWNHISRESPYYPSYLIHQVFESSLQSNRKQEYTFAYGIMETATDYENWYQNQKLISGVAKEFGITYFCMLQPCIFTGSYQASVFESDWLRMMYESGLEEHRSARNIYTKWKPFYEGASRLIEQETQIIDATHLFDGLSGIYIDGIHCEEVGNYHIAKRMLRCIQESRQI